MRKMVLALSVLLLGLASGSIGCATSQLGAQQVGSAEDSTWVFVQTDNKSENGIYRCHDEAGVVSCTKARIDN